ncbi:MAG: helix-turn-helix transcriptional regulator [Fusobacterium sp.]|nr:helix-turn-helix transcriptional regulator [Fusobacterium sp.]
MTKNKTKFTQREIIVLTEVLKGKTNNEISKEFFVTLHTVKAHIQNLLTKTKTRHRSELISKFFTEAFEFDINSNSVNSIAQKMQ